jgi:transposase InsO family protein
VAVKAVAHKLARACYHMLRDECLNVHQFASLAEAQAIIEAWRVDYNTGTVE